VCRRAHELGDERLAGTSSDCSVVRAILSRRCEGNREVLVHRQELSMPPTTTLDQALGFSLYMMRAVLSGRGDEVIDLARTNLFR
jgi:hypothetical protein